MKQLRNYTEEAVQTYVDKWFPKIDVCQCESCRLDVMAMMLNQIQPHYVVTDKGALFAQLNGIDVQNVVDMVSYFTSAVETVKKKPRH